LTNTQSIMTGKKIWTTTYFFIEKIVAKVLGARETATVRLRVAVEAPTKMEAMFL